MIMFDLEQFKTGMIALTRNGQEVKYVSVYSYKDNLTFYGVSNHGQVLGYDKDGLIDSPTENPMDLVNMNQPAPISLYAIYTADGEMYHVQEKDYVSDEKLMEQFGSPITIVPLVQKLKLSRTLIK
jgi:hypothetical protein